MSHKVVNIARNTSYYTISLILQKIISLAYFTVLARNLPPSELGKYYFAISYTTVFGIFIDIGLFNVLTREIARIGVDDTLNEDEKKAKAEKFFSTIFMFKFVAAFLVFAVLAIFINFLNYPEMVRNLIYLSAISMMIDALSITQHAIMRGFHNLKYESISVLIYQVIILVFGTIAVKLRLGLYAQMLVIVSASSFNFFFPYFILRTKINLRLFRKVDFKLLKKILILTLPFSVFAVTQRFYSYLDTIMLSKMAGDVEVGIYQVPFKIITALQFLPMAFTASLYPAFSNYWRTNKEQLANSFERAMNYLLIIAVPISIGTIAMADKIVIVFSESYTGSILPLKITMLSLIFIFLLFPIGAIFNATDNQKINTRVMIIALIVSFLMNLLLIPQFKSVGASITVLATNALMFILSVVKIPTIIKYQPRKNIIVFMKTIFSAIIMTGAVLLLKESLNIILVVIIGALVYFFAQFTIRTFQIEDVRSIIKSFKKS